MLTTTYQTILAQQVPTSKIVTLIGGAIVVLIVAGLLLMALRRRLLAQHQEGESLDMETLQRQHREGVISDDEFKTLRRVILGLPAEGEPPKEAASGNGPENG